MSACRRKSATIIFMAKNDYDNWDKQQLINEIRALKKRKRYGLVWEDKPEQVAIDCEINLPILKEVKKYAIATDTNAPTNLMIEGDNYHALSVLNYTHKGKIDAIYIDPPYNTGARDWKYNNNYVDKHDGYRHSKWLSMMAKRLILSKNLLRNDGMICVAIDHNEIFYLGALCDEIFGENNRIAVISVEHNPQGRTYSKFVSTTNEFLLIYAKNIGCCKINNLSIGEDRMHQYKYEDNVSKYKRIPLRKTGFASRKEDRPTQFFPFWYNPTTKVLSLSESANAIKILPTNRNGENFVWRISFENCRELARNNNIDVVERAGKFTLYKKQRLFVGRKPTTIWKDTQHNASVHGAGILNCLLENNSFDFPKSVYAVKDSIQMMSSNPNAIILDFFAGSGTTGHAVSILNKKDGGNRRFILCTNNENDIASKVCYPRIKKVIKGHKKHLSITGIASNLKYYKTTFVSASTSDDNKAKITQKMADMLCVRENTFEEVKICQSYQIYRNENRHTGIIYAERSITDFKKYAAKIRGKFHVYVFSLGKEDYAEEFADMLGKVQTHPIPEEILHAYRQIFQKRNMK